MNGSDEKPCLVIRQAQIKDVSDISQLSKKIYSEKIGYSHEQVLGHINHFPEGQFVAEYGNKIIGYCSSIILPEERALGKHSWREVTGNGYGSTHNPKGQYLYGIDVFVDPSYRKIRVGARFYKARKNLCKKLNLQGIVFSGRMPLFKKKQSIVKTPEEYLKLVLDKKIKDPVINFQVRQGFEIIQVLKDYLPHDSHSLGCAVQMIWQNPLT
jgi:GNAT superfamily N-acetyltransferase